jgi:hypothetical protein
LTPLAGSLDRETKQKYSSIIFHQVDGAIIPQIYIVSALFILFFRPVMSIYGRSKALVRALSERQTCESEFGK